MWKDSSTMLLKRIAPGLTLLMLLIATSNLGIVLDDSDNLESMFTSARDDDYCEETYTTESACNSDSQCEWDAEDDPDDDD